VRRVVLRRVALRGFDAVVERFAVERLAVERFAAGLRAADVRLAPAVADFAREPVERFAVERFAVERFAVERLAVERFAVDLRAPPRADEPELVLALAPPSIDHLPDMTRCAASATASAISEPSFVALDATLLAACCAVSAASRPASRIALRAFGLAAIAAAAAVKPAASISLLIAAFAILSIVALPDELEELDLEEPDLEVLEDLEELLRAALAIASSPSVAQQRHFSATTVPAIRKCAVADKLIAARCASREADMLKGTAGVIRDALRHGQRPEMWPFVSF
jgi:hypothetical protein